jgi:hypothetical protein
VQTSQQPSSRPDDRHRELVKRAADLCRAQPAVFAAAVRHSDALEAAGVDRHEALDLALREVDC